MKLSSQIAIFITHMSVIVSVKLENNHEHATMNLLSNHMRR